MRINSLRSVTRAAAFALIAGIVRLGKKRREIKFVAGGGGIARTYGTVLCRKVVGLGKTRSRNILTLPYLTFYFN